MSKRNERRSAPVDGEASANEARRFMTGKHWFAVGAVVFVFLIVGGVLARNGWLPSRTTGWFATPLAKNASSGWNPLAAPLPTPTPSLSKEYIYASGGRLLSVVDANAQAAPPADLAVWRPGTGTWCVVSGSGAQQQQWGAENDDPVAGDYDGDGKTDFAVFRPSNNNWYIVYSSDSTTAGYSFGASGDVPAPADYDGDGETESALFRPSEGKWYVRLDDAGNTTQQQFGADGDQVAPADYDGDGRADIGVWRSSDQTFYSMNSSNGLTITAPHGQPGKPVSSDYDGDGKADYAIFNPTGGHWYIRHSSTGVLQSPIQWGAAGGTDEVVQNDYDGDGKCDIAVWRPSNGTWYIKQSSGTDRYEQFGLNGDIPVPAVWRR